MNYKPRHLKNTKLLAGNNHVIDRKYLTAYFSVYNIIIFPKADTNIRILEKFCSQFFFTLHLPNAVEP